MKRLLFAFSAILFSLGLLAFSFFRSEEAAPISVPTVSGALSGDAVFTVSPSGNDWNISSEENSGGINARKLSPLSSVFTPADQSGVRVENGEKGEKKILIDRGRYVFSFEDSLASFVVEFPTFSIRQISRGTFLVDTTDTSNIRIYSVSSILSVSLFALENKTEKETELLIFPSMLFEHNPKFNEELKSADILRVATIHSLLYVPLFTSEGLSPSIATNRGVKGLLEASIAFLRKQDQDAAQSVDSLFSQKTSYETTLFDLFPFLFVNSDKRAILLQNLLFNDLQDLFELSQETNCSKNKCDTGKLFSSIDMILMELRGIRESEYQKGLDLIKNAYHITYAKASSNAEEMNQVNPFILLLKRVFKDAIEIDSMEYTTLSGMYRDEMLRGKGETSISKKLDGYLRTIISKKAIRRSDFLSFVFFIKEYLSHPMPKIGTSELDIIYYLVAISNEYYATLANDDQKFSLLSVYFYNYEKIISRTSQNIVSNFFRQSDPFLLKEEFINPEGDAMLEEGLVVSMGSIAKVFTESDPYFSTQLALYYTLLNSGKDANIADRFTVFESTMKNFTNIQTVLADYKSYTDRMALKEDARGAQGIVFSNTVFPSLEEVRTYFSQFSGMIPDSLQTTGGSEKEWFYLLSFQIDGRIVSLKFIPEGHTIEDIVFTSPSGEVNRAYRKFSISLDEKKKMAEEAVDRGIDFSQFFQNTFLSPVAESNPVSDKPVEGASNGPEMTQEMKLFTDRELIGKDFKNIAAIFPATLSNIYAEVKNGEYDITLTNIKSRINGEDELSETVEFSGKYLFSQSVHAFYRLSIGVLNDSWEREFGGASINLSPSRIDLQNFERISKEMPKYIKTLRNAKYSGNEKATFDLSRQVVIIGTNEYPLGS